MVRAGNTRLRIAFAALHWGLKGSFYSLKSKRRASRLLQEFPGHEVGDAKDGGKSLELQGGLLTRATSTEPGPINSKPFLPNMY